MKSRAPQLHLEYRFYRQLGQSGRCLDGWMDEIELYIPVGMLRSITVILR